MGNSLEEWIKAHSTLPDGFEDQIVNRVEIRFGWRDRLEILFGAPVNLSVETLCEYKPGNVRAETTVDVFGLVRRLRCRFFPQFGWVETGSEK